MPRPMALLVMTALLGACGSRSGALVPDVDAAPALDAGPDTTPPELPRGGCSQSGTSTVMVDGIPYPAVFAAVDHTSCLWTLELRFAALGHSAMTATSAGEPLELTVELGDQDEPELDGVRRTTGRLYREGAREWDAEGAATIERLDLLDPGLRYCEFESCSGLRARGRFEVSSDPPPDVDLEGWSASGTFDGELCGYEIWCDL